jgi:hypothetical protein
MSAQNGNQNECKMGAGVHLPAKWVPVFTYGIAVYTYRDLSILTYGCKVAAQES